MKKYYNNKRLFQRPCKPSACRTLIVVSFSTLFLVNMVASEFFSDANMNTQYYIKFSEPQELETIKKVMRESFIYPSNIYYFD